MKGGRLTNTDRPANTKPGRGHRTLSAPLMIISQKASVGQWLGGVHGCPPEWLSSVGADNYLPRNNVTSLSGSVTAHLALCNFVYFSVHSSLSKNCSTDCNCWLLLFFLWPWWKKKRDRLKDCFQLHEATEARTERTNKVTTLHKVTHVQIEKCSLLRRTSSWWFIGLNHDHLLS